MKTTAIIQAHMGSTRLFGKVLSDICGRPMLVRVIDRVRRATLIDEVVVATSDLAPDDAIVARCSSVVVACFRGSDRDVLDRFTMAARRANADVIVRITSDCPLIDPDVIDAVIDRFMSSPSPVDYASNKIPQSFPRGLDTEVFTREALERTWREAGASYERTHVTPYIYEHPDAFRLLSVTNDVDRADWRWTVDAVEDLQFVREIYSRLGAEGLFTWHDVVALLEKEPSVREINRTVRQKGVREG
jgi:spore coat polysaccharide biosynthesis protein SpsF